MQLDSGFFRFRELRNVPVTLPLIFTLRTPGGNSEDPVWENLHEYALASVRTARLACYLHDEA